MKWMYIFGLSLAILILLRWPHFFSTAPSSEIAKEHINAGKKWQAEENDWKARVSFTQAIKHDPNNADAYFLRGVSQLALGYHDKAIADFSEALQLKPNNANTYYNRALALARSKDYKGAINDFNKSLELEPREVSVYRDRGLVKQRLGDNLGAMEDFQQALTLNSNYVDAYLSKGALLIDMGRTEDGLSAYQQALTYKPALKKHFVLVDGCGVWLNDNTQKLEYVPCQ